MFVFVMSSGAVSTFRALLRAGRAYPVSALGSRDGRQRFDVLATRRGLPTERALSAVDKPILADATGSLILVSA